MASWRVVNPDPSSPQGLGVGRSDISDMPIEASDELDILFMRQDHLNKEIDSSLEDGRLKQKNNNGGSSSSKTVGLQSLAQY